jgi:hypothetical protein
VPITCQSSTITHNPSRLDGTPFTVELPIQASLRAVLTAAAQGTGAAAEELGLVEAGSGREFWGADLAQSLLQARVVAGGGSTLHLLRQDQRGLVRRGAGRPPGGAGGGGRRMMDADGAHPVRTPAPAAAFASEFTPGALKPSLRFWMDRDFLCVAEETPRSPSLCLDLAKAM